MTITAKVIADSISDADTRLTTFELCYPRFIHAEFMTHRMFSRNASSSRAIPVERQIEAIMENPAMPSHWGMNQSGMQADEETDALIYGDFCELDMIDNSVEGITSEQAWLKARDRAVEIAQGFVDAGYHKQIVNRLLEPFTHIKVVCTSTNYDNFYHLRRHKDAQPEIKILADAMWNAHEESAPKVLKQGMWHLPYVTEEEIERVSGGKEILHKEEYGDGNGFIYGYDDLIKFSVARCARVSYDNHDGTKANPVNDLKLYNRLVGATPLHASPAEHQARPDVMIYENGEYVWKEAHLSGNFSVGWVQYRKTLDNECEYQYVPTS